ncbi:MAG: hypothetical protein ACYC9R_12840 [Nitrosotalea sp.]
MKTQMKMKIKAEQESMRLSTKTHKDDARVQIFSALVVFFLVLVMPYLTYIVTTNITISLLFGIIAIGAGIDIVGTVTAMRQGYFEGNFYRILLERYGNRNGLRFMVTLNVTMRIIFVSLLYSSPLLLLLVALIFLVAPLWNAVLTFSFHNDIVLTVPTILSSEGEGEIDLEIPTMEKRRLQSQKSETDHANYYTLQEAREILADEGWCECANDCGSGSDQERLESEA